MMTGVSVDDARDADLAPILAIYNREIREGVALWNAAERRLETMRALVAERRAGGFATIVARDPNGSVLGYGGYGPFRPHDGYAKTVEHSVYVRPEAARRGVGRRLLEALEARARAGGFHVMIGGLEAGNAASVALHRALGFEEVARLPEVGRKFDRWLTLVLMQKILD